MRKPVAGKDRQLLPANQRGKPVDCTDARLDKIFRVLAQDGIDRHAIDVAHLVGVNVAQPVDRPPASRQHAPEQLLGKRHGHGLACHLRRRIRQRQAVRALEHLYHSPAAMQLDNAALPLAPVRSTDFHHFLIGRAMHAVQDYKRAIDLLQSDIFKRHSYQPPAVRIRFLAAPRRSCP